jgi:pimeloyl-ACP methyl ester carboxylesterase
MVVRCLILRLNALSWHCRAGSLSITLTKVERENSAMNREDCFVMQPHDNDLSRFEADSAAPLPVASDQGHVEWNGARIWYSTFGDGPPVILLHGGLGHSGNWGFQVPAVVEGGYRAVLIDSRGHGRSTRDAQLFSYELMASDVLAVMDALHLEKAGLVGWSDGSCTALILAAKAPARVSGVFFFGCNMDPSGVKPFEATPTVSRCFARHAKDYAQLSATPEDFKQFVEAVTLMQRTQPNYSAADLAEISVPVVIVHSEHDEFIKPEHAEYLARSIPNAELVVLDGVSHFAPLQRPEQFNSAMLAFLHALHRTSPASVPMREPSR